MNYNPLQTKMLQEQIDRLNIPERIVLVGTGMFKSSYNGVKELRYKKINEHTGMTKAQYESIKDELKRIKFMTKGNALTAYGKQSYRTFREEWTSYKNFFKDYSHHQTDDVWTDS